MILHDTFAATPLDRTSLPQGALDVAQRVRTNPLPWTGQFSPQLVEKLPAACAPRHGVVLDPFAGSGTSLVEADIYEDILHFRTTEELPDDGACLTAARRIAGQVLSAARGLVPDTERPGLEDAMARLDEITQSPMAAPEACSPRRSAAGRR